MVPKVFKDFHSLKVQDSAKSKAWNQKEKLKMMKKIKVISLSHKYVSFSLYYIQLLPVKQFPNCSVTIYTTVYLYIFIYYT